MKMMSFHGWGDPTKAADSTAMPKLWPLIEQRLGLSPDHITPPVPFASIEVPASRATDTQITALAAIVGPENTSTSRETRLLHSFGKSYRDLLRARQGKVPRSPDVVVFPTNHDQVTSLLQVAVTHGLKLVPFGGGTNIVGGVEASPAIAEPVVTVSLRHLNQLVSLDETSGIAVLQAGMLGPELEAALEERGFTLGHFPDSFEFSTLGGWLATRSAGMQSDHRGNIKDMVVALRMATPTGDLRTSPVPHSAAGPDITQIAVGSEGVLGIITEATMRVYRVQPREYRGVLMPTIEAGIEFMRRCHESDVAPSTMRLSDAEETLLSSALKPPSGKLEKRITPVIKSYLQRVRGFDPDEICLLILGWEGTGPATTARRNAALKIARQLNGFDAGNSPGNAWYARKYDYPYLRDFLMHHGGLVDVAETSTSWREALSTYQVIREGLRQEVARGDFPGYVGCHFSHSYPTGVCLYFTFATARDADHPLDQYRRIKGRSMDLIMRQRAALSHHHAVGYEHLPWMAQYQGAVSMAILRQLKQGLDPAEVCNPGKLIPTPASALPHYWPHGRDQDPGA